jgi:hypothetical protein
MMHHAPSVLRTRQPLSLEDEGHFKGFVGTTPVSSVFVALKLVARNGRHYRKAG